jgi:hypothetical protein
VNSANLTENNLNILKMLNNSFQNKILDVCDVVKQKNGDDENKEKKQKKVRKIDTFVCGLFEKKISKQKTYFKNDRNHNVENNNNNNNDNFSIEKKSENLEVEIFFFECTFCKKNLSSEQVFFNIVYIYIFFIFIIIYF